MKILTHIVVLIIGFQCSVNAEEVEVHKCKSPNGEIHYQHKPCPPDKVTKKVLEIEEMTPQEKADAEAKHKADEQRRAAYEASRAQEKMQQQRERQRQQELELERHRLMLQEKEAIEAERRRAWGPTFMPHYWGNDEGF